MKNRLYVVITLLSAALIALEIIWTRIFSAEFYYTFAFLILSLAILGLGLGALSVRLFSLSGTKHLFGLLIGTAIFALAGPPIVLHIGLAFTQVLANWLMCGKLLLTLLLLGLPYYFGGMAISIIFKNDPDNMPRLYMADLVGAACGVLFAIFLMNTLGTPTATILIILPVLIAAFFVQSGWKLILPLVLIGLSSYSTIYAEKYLEKPRKERAPVTYKHWDAMSKIKIYEFAENYWGLNIDNLANSPVYQFDGNWDRPDSMKFEFAIDVKYLIDQNEDCTFLSLGAGGGTDVLQALQHGATKVHAVEVIPHINKLMLDGILADFSGNIYSDPRVKVVSEDARAYVRRFENEFDMIYSLSANTFAALASGSFALAENYIFTTEAFADYYKALSDNGFLMMEHQFYMPRLATEALDALKSLGIDNPQDHIAIYNLPQMRRNIILMGKQPLTETIRQNAFAELSPEIHEHIHLLYPAADSLQNNPIHRIVTQGWESVQADMPINISPCNDNRPFVAQLGLLSNFSTEEFAKLRLYEFRGFPLSKIVILTILAIVLVLILPLTLLPAIRKANRMNPASWFYFFFIGMGFMIIEIVLMQKYTLFIGPSSYTVVVILLTLLLGSGIGSRFSAKIQNWVPFVFILLWLVAEVIMFTPLKYALGSMTMMPRILLSAALIFPLGFFMGMPFPKGALKIGERIDWGFAVNGAASVIGSVLVLLLAMEFGLVIALTAGGSCYVFAWLLLPQMN